MEQIKGLKDIKGIVEVTDYSLWWLLGLIAAAALFLGAVLYLLKRKRRIRRRFLKSPEELARERIESIDFDDPKSVAYTFVEDVARFVDEKSAPEYARLAKALEPYKYKKEVPAMDDRLKEEIRKFIEEIKWES